MDLSDAYRNAAYIPGAAAFPPRWARAAKAYRESLALTGQARLGLMYGHGSRQVLDLFLPDRPAKGAVVFVHGGYWRQFDGSSWSHLAHGCRTRGWAVAIPSYDLCPRVRIADITRQIAQAVTVVANQVPGPLRLTGHSAGGQLAARMLAPGLLPDAVAARLAHVLPISPLSDLAPLMQTDLNTDLGLTPSEAQRESPLNQPAPTTPVTVWVGGDERPAFLDQARWLANAWGCGHVIAEGTHHFDVIDPLADPESAMTNRLLS